MSSDGRDKQYTCDFFDDMDRKSWSSASVIASLVTKLVRPASVVDIGCGRGVWLAAFKEAGAGRVFGVDGPWVKRDEVHIPQSSFANVDLAGDWSVPGSYDLAICLEVGEHLRDRHAARLVNRLTSLAPVVLFSAALPGQGGTDHVNEQWPSYWAEKFLECGFVRLDPIRRAVWQDDRVAWFYQQNVFLFASESVVAASPELQREAHQVERCELTLVHDKVLARLRSVRGVLGLIPELLLAAFRRRFSSSKGKAKVLPRLGETQPSTVSPAPSSTIP